MDYPCAKFSDFSFSRFWFTDSDRQTDGHTAKRFTPSTVVGVSNQFTNRLYQATLCKEHYKIQYGEYVSVSVCLSVCPSLCYPIGLYRNSKIYHQFFSPLLSSIILVFSYKIPWLHFYVSPSTKGLNTEIHEWVAFLSQTHCWPTALYKTNNFRSFLNSQ